MNHSGQKRKQVKPVEKEFAKIIECKHKVIQFVSCVKFCKPVFYGFNKRILDMSHKKFYYLLTFA